MSDSVYLVIGVALLLAVLLPAALRRHAVSAPMVLLLVGMLIGLLPHGTDDPRSIEQPHWSSST